MILFGKSAKHGEQALLSLAACHLLFRIQAGVEMSLEEARVTFHGAVKLLAPGALFQSQIVGNAKNPPAQILAGPSQLQVPEKRKKNLLNDLLAVVG
ncbi:MAG TPA: hypothetical protein VMI06_13325 [Terriglobia bacterium]|nr:hypothetical protein [Terriglobia bacterium]